MSYMRSCLRKKEKNTKKYKINCRAGKMAQSIKYLLYLAPRLEFTPKYLCRSRVWQYVLVILMLGSQRQEDPGTYWSTSLAELVSPRLCERSSLKMEINGERFWI